MTLAIYVALTFPLAWVIFLVPGGREVWLHSVLGLLTSLSVLLGWYTGTRAFYTAGVLFLLPDLLFWIMGAAWKMRHGSWSRATSFALAVVGGLQVPPLAALIYLISYP